MLTQKFIFCKKYLYFGAGLPPSKDEIKVSLSPSFDRALQ